MASTDDQILRTAKEIAVKFIETGRVSHTSFPEVFDTIYNAVKDTVVKYDNRKEKKDQSPGPMGRFGSPILP